MPTYVITAPDGNEYEVDAPEGASEQDVLAYAQQNYKQATPKSRATATPAARGTDGMSGLDRFRAGIGKSLVDTYDGVKQGMAGGANRTAGSASLGLRAAGMEGASDWLNRNVGLPAYQWEQSENANAADRRALDADLMETGSGAAGNFIGQATQLALPAGATARTFNYAGRAAPYLASAAEGAAFAGAQPVVGQESRAGKAAVGGAAGAAGQGVVNGATRLTRGVMQNPRAQQAYALAKQYGVTLSPAQLMDNATVNTVLSAISKLPLTGGRKLASEQREQFNRAVSQQFGANSPAIDSQVYSGAKRAIGQRFNDLSARNNLRLDDNVLTRLADIEAEAGVSTDASKAVNNVLEDLLRHAQDEQVSGRAYKSFDERIGRQLKAAQGESRHYLGMVRDAVRRGMDDSISPADRAAWQGARQQYRALKTVRDLVAKEDGEGIAPGQLMGRVTANNAGKEAMASGRAGPMGDLAQVGRRLADRAPDSGTALRSLVYNGAGVGVAGGGAAASTSDNPIMRGAGILTLLAMGGARAGNSPKLARMMMEGSRTMQGMSRRIPAPARKVAAKQIPRWMMLMPGAAVADE